MSDTMKRDVRAFNALIDVLCKKQYRWKADDIRVMLDLSATATESEARAALLRASTTVLALEKIASGAVVKAA